jgi:hypothetical protein
MSIKEELLALLREDEAFRNEVATIIGKECAIEIQHRRSWGEATLEVKLFVGAEIHSAETEMP